MAVPLAQVKHMSPARRLLLLLLRRLRTTGASKQWWHVSPARRPLLLLLLLLDVLQELPQLGQVLRTGLEVLVVKAFRQQRRDCCGRKLSQPPASTDINHLHSKEAHSKEAQQHTQPHLAATHNKKLMQIMHCWETTATPL
jgi:hypothetical protein